MRNIVLDFRRGYVRGERLQSEDVAYQHDTGRIAEVYVPEEEESYALHVGYENYSALIVVDDVTVEEDVENGGFVLTATLPDSVFEDHGNLLIYVVAEADGATATMYEGAVTVRQRGGAE